MAGVEILIVAAVVAVLVFAGSFAWRWWKARQAAADSAVPPDAAEDAGAVLDAPSTPKRLSGADAAIADDLAASIASAAKARAAVAKSAEPRRKPKKRAAPKRSAKSAKKRRRA